MVNSAIHRLVTERTSEQTFKVFQSMERDLVNKYNYVVSLWRRISTTTGELRHDNMMGLLYTLEDATKRKDTESAKPSEEDRLFLYVSFGILTQAKHSLRARICRRVQMWLNVEHGSHTDLLNEILLFVVASAMVHLGCLLICRVFARSQDMTSIKLKICAEGQ
ncbi:hypothetical protein M9H77_27880 [Catharanthus roseus]|uniref:Uncharacterized protein n=1 Tax=Catharanthus roseus TaxID=4058 RepID=A0ACC0AGF4_CATRO|nr:hypothetical protein M9H77_27880 [Catharanthus roseus]